jgi:hypothetical protein
MLSLISHQFEYASLFTFAFCPFDRSSAIELWVVVFFVCVAAELKSADDELHNVSST